MSLPSSNAASNHRLHLAVFAAGFATFVNMYCTQSILPVLAKAFAVPPGATGLTITAPLVATAIMAPAIGAISDRFGRRKLILGAALLLVLPTAMTASSGSFHALILWRFIQGIVLPFIFTVTIAYIGEETEGATATKLAATYASGAIFGGFAGRTITGFGTEYFGWRIAMLLVAAATLAAAGAIALWLKPETRFRPVRGFAQALRAFPAHLANPSLLATYLIGFGVLFCLIAVFTFVNFRLAAPPYNLGPAALGGIFVVYLSGMVMNHVAARLANRFGRGRVMLLAVPAAIAGLCLTLMGPLPVIILGLLLISNAIFVEQTLATSFLGIAARHAKSAAVGLYVTFYYVGGSLGGIAPATLWRDYGWPGCVVLVCCMQLAMLAVALRFWSARQVRPSFSEEKEAKRLF